MFTYSGDNMFCALAIICSVQWRYVLSSGDMFCAVAITLNVLITTATR